MSRDKKKPRSNKNDKVSCKKSKPSNSHSNDTKCNDNPGKYGERNGNAGDCKSERDRKRQDIIVNDSAPPTTVTVAVDQNDTFYSSSLFSSSASKAEGAVELIDDVTDCGNRKEDHSKAKKKKNKKKVDKNANKCSCEKDHIRFACIVDEKPTVDCSEGYEGKGQVGGEKNFIESVDANNSRNVEGSLTTTTKDERDHDASRKVCSSDLELNGNFNDMGRFVASSYCHFIDPDPSNLSTTSIINKKSGISLLLFYQYITPLWSVKQMKDVFQYVRTSGKLYNLGGRMRVAREGLNCTLTGQYDNIRNWCRDLRLYGSLCDCSCPSLSTQHQQKPLEHEGDHYFKDTEFKVTDNLPDKYMFPKLNIFHVDELVNYGLADNNSNEQEVRNTNIIWKSQAATHLEPEEYHAKMAEKDTVIIDVRNHYEAVIGHFDPPSTGAELLDPKMRKSTEFPEFINKPETREKLRGKQVLMYCTGGVRCERASALLQQKLATDKSTKELGVKGIYQLQGGVDKYFKSFPDGGYWTGKNYVFDKRFAHAPPLIEKRGDQPPPLGRCEACSQPWDKYVGKRRCPTCGVPSLICRDCHIAHEEGRMILDKSVRCSLCVEQSILSKFDFKSLDKTDLKSRKKRKKASALSTITNDLSTTEIEYCNPNNITRLYVGNLCNKTTSENTLAKFLPGIKYVQWLLDRRTGEFRGSCFVEMDSTHSAAFAVAKSGTIIAGRAATIKYQKLNGKDVWPPPNAVKISSKWKMPLPG